MGDQVVALKNKSHTVVPVSVPVTVLEGLGRRSVNDQVATVILVKPADDVQAGCFTRTAGPENSHELVFAEIETYIIKCSLCETAGGIAFGDVFKLQHTVNLILSHP
ncbi:hypothetical protein D3C76_1545210 [compost metagenome]